MAKFKKDYMIFGSVIRMVKEPLIRINPISCFRARVDYCGGQGRSCLPRLHPHILPPLAKNKSVVLLSWLLPQEKRCT